MNIYHDIGHLNTNIETPHCRCIPQVKATDVNEVLNRFYYFLTVKTSSWHNTKPLKPHCLLLGMTVKYHASGLPRIISVPWI